MCPVLLIFNTVAGRLGSRLRTAGGLDRRQRRPLKSFEGQVHATHRTRSDSAQTQIVSSL